MCLCVDSKLQVDVITHQKVKCLLDEDFDTMESGILWSQVFFLLRGLVEYNIQKLPLGDSIQQNASWIDFEQKMKADVPQAEYFISRLGTIYSTAFMCMFVRVCS